MKIELTPIEIEVLKEEIENEENGILTDRDSSSEKGRAFASVIEKADNLMNELNAYDEIGDSLIKWFFKKYKEQTN